MGKEEYQAYLQSEEWHSIRRQIYDRAEGMCEVCTADVEAVHHRHYPKALEDDTIQHKIAVCNRCHKAIHGIHDKRKKTAYIIASAVAELEEQQMECWDKLIDYYRGKLHG